MPDEKTNASILICENESLVADDLERRLLQLGYKIGAKEVSAGKVLDRAAEIRPDLVLMDIAVQGDPDGISAAEIIRTQWDIPVIFLTADAEAHRLEQAKLTHPFGYLLKPVRTRDLKITLEMALYVAGIDRKRRQEETLRNESEQRLNLFMNHFPGVAFLKEADGRVVFANDRYYEVGGLDRKAVEGLPYTQYLPPAIADDFRREDALVLSNNQALETEQMFPTEKGNTYWLTKKFPIHRQQAQPLIGGISIDVTERILATDALQDSEEKFRSISEQMIETVFLTDCDGVITYMSPMAEEIFGFKVDEMVNRHFTLFLDKESVPVSMPEFVCLLEEGIPTKNLRMKMIKKDGTRFTGELSATAYLKHGHVVGTIGVIRDITEQEKAEHQLQAALHEKEILLKELNHRVKNNMQVIISLMKLQSNKLDDESTKAIFLESQSRIYAMAAVHESLYQSDNLARINLSSYIMKLGVTTFQVYRTDSGNIDLSVRVDPIPVRLEQSYAIGLVINELLSNALKYAFPDSRKGVIRISGQCPDHSRLTIEVSDDGVGLPEHFDFRQVDSLGLQLVRNLVEGQLGGVIAVDTDQGTRWKMEFPINNQGA